MKRILLLSALLIGSGLMVFAQRDLSIKKLTFKPVIENNIGYMDNPMKELPLIPIKKAALTSRTSTISRILFSSSANFYSLWDGQSNILTSQAGSKLILATHRDGGIFGGDGNSVKFKFSSNFGETWDSITYNIGEKSLRYPSGSIFSTGSFTPENTWIAGCGPYSINKQWSGNWIMSTRLDSSFINDTLLEYPNTDFIRLMTISQTVTGDNRLHSMSENFKGYLLDGQFKYISFAGYEIFTGEFNNTTHQFDMDSSVIISPLLSKNQPAIMPRGMVWNRDGSIGYVYFIAKDSLKSPTLFTQPIIYKSTDHGKTWNKLPIADFSKVQGLKDYVWPLLDDTTKIRPVFDYGFEDSETDIPATVDANGNLHLGTIVRGGVTNNLDSLSYIYTEEPLKLFDLVLSNDSIWTAELITELKSNSVKASASGYGKGSSSSGWDHRIHISKSDNDKMIFYLWTDTESETLESNISPDIYGRAIDLENEKVSNIKNFTGNTDYSGDNYFMNAAEEAFTEEGTYKIPVTTAELNFAGGTLYPINHVLVTGINFNADDFIPNAITENFKTIYQFSSSIFPNPVKDNANINVIIPEKGKLEISIQNALGQNVINVFDGNIDAGKQTFKINASKLKAGLYFVVIKCGELKTAHKLIIE